MTKAQQFSREIQSKRREITQLREDLANLQDHLLVVEARAKNAGSRRFRRRRRARGWDWRGGGERGWLEAERRNGLDNRVRGNLT